MGTQRVGTLPDTIPWRRVVGLIAKGADAPEVAAATTQAARTGLDRARGDEGLTHCILLLARLLRAAREPDFAGALCDCGLTVPPAPDLFDLVAAFSDAVDRQLTRTCGRTDLGEMAQLAAVEALTTVLGGRSDNLFGITHAEVRRAARDLSTARGFGTLAHELFARFARRFLDYHLGRELALNVGVNGRFADPLEHNRFLEDLAVHCREAAAIAREYAADCYSKANSPRGGGLTAAKARDFVDHVITKLQNEFRVRGTRDV
jgi:hypothetical protein